MYIDAFVDHLVNNLQPATVNTQNTRKLAAIRYRKLNIYIMYMVNDFLLSENYYNVEGFERKLLYMIQNTPEILALQPRTKNGTLKPFTITDLQNHLSSFFADQDLSDLQEPEEN